MNNFVTEIKGYMPIYQKDIKFIFDTVLQVVDGLSSLFGSDFILSGCKSKLLFTGTLISSGWVVISGELCYHAGTVLSENTGYWKIVDLLLPESERDFELPDNEIITHKVWKSRIAIPCNESEIGSVQLIRNAKNEIDSIVHNHDDIYLKYEKTYSVDNDIDMTDNTFDNYRLFLIHQNGDKATSIILPEYNNLKSTTRLTFINRSDMPVKFKNTTGNILFSLEVSKSVDIEVLDSFNTTTYGYVINDMNFAT